MRSTLDRIDNWLERAEGARFNAARLAKECGVSQRHLCRYFRDHCGTSPQKWLDDVRVWKSLPRLLETRYVFGVADELDFKRAATFSEHFRDHFGCLPSEFFVNPDKSLECVVAKNPGLLQADGSVPMDELSKLAVRTIEFVRRQKKHGEDVHET